MKKKAIKNESLVFFACKVIAGILSLVAISIRTHFIDRTIYSNYVLIAQTISLAISLIITWVVESSGRYYEQTKDKTIFFTTYLMNYLVSYFIGLGILVLLNFANGKDLLLQYFPYAISLFFVNGFVELIHQIFRMSHKTIAYGITIIAAAVLNVVVFLILPKNTNVIVLLLTSIIANLLIVIFAIFYLRIFKFFNIKKYSLSLTKKSIVYAAPLIVVWGCIWIFNSSDVFVINFVLGNKENGEVAIYNVAHSLTTQSIGILTGALTFAVFPKLISQYLANDSNAVSKSISFQVDMCLKICVPAIFGLTAVSPMIYSTIISNSYSFGSSSQLLILLFSLTTVFSGIENLIVRPWQLEEKTTNIMIGYVISAILNLVLDFLFVSLYGFVAAAVVSCSIIFVRMIIIFIIMNKKRNIKFNFLNLFITLLASFFMLAFVKRIIELPVHNNYLKLFTGVFIGLVFYAIMIFALDKDLRSIVQGVLKRRIRK